MTALEAKKLQIILIQICIKELQKEQLSTLINELKKLLIVGIIALYLERQMKIYQ